jgi:hypothetical protein
MTTIDTNTKPMIKSQQFWKEIAMTASAVAAYVGGAIDAKASIGVILFSIAGIIIRRMSDGKVISGIVKQK